jgi:hypothetical protein
VSVISVPLDGGVTVDGRYPRLNGRHPCGRQASHIDWKCSLCSLLHPVLFEVKREMQLNLPNIASTDSWALVLLNMLYESVVGFGATKRRRFDLSD